jgi:DNA repair protein RAD5
VLTLLLRLRQAVDHPFLVLNRTKDAKEFEVEVHKFIHRFVRNIDLSAQGAPSLGFLENLTKELKSRHHASNNNPSNDASARPDATPPPLQECPICLSDFDTPVLTECAHMMCRECLMALMNERGFARCPLCRSVVNSEKLFLVPEAGPAASSSATAANSDASSSDAAVDNPAADTSSQRTAAPRIDTSKQWRHSSKTARLLSELAKLRSDPATSRDKVVVFSQWTSMLDLLEVMFRKEGITFCRLDGSLSQKQRQEVLRAFAKPLPSPPPPSASSSTHLQAAKDLPPLVMLISLKAGGLGLNLVAANHCFLFDSWFNPSVEEQACQRVHRIGQTKETFVKRLVCPGTVEERILDLQNRKKLLAHAVNRGHDKNNQPSDDSGDSGSKQINMKDLVDLFRDS